MSKKKKTSQPVKNLALSQEERKLADAGRSIVASLLGKLLDAWRQDFREVLIAVGIDVAKPEDLGSFGDGPEHCSAITRRLSLGLEYTVSDSDSATELGGPPVSYEHGIDSVLSLARMILPRHFIDGWQGHKLADNVESLRYEIDGCIISLVACGKLQHAADLMCLVGVVMAIDRDKIGATAEKLRPRTSKRHSDNFHKLKLLLALDACFQRGEIPTKSRLRNEFFTTKDTSSFSVVLKGMRIRDLLPEESRGRKAEDRRQGASFPFTILPEFMIRRKSIVSSPSIIQAAEVIDGADTNPHSLQLTHDAAMIDRDIRVIRERLGPVYHLLLIEFGMSELADEEDLRAFETRLSERGMRLS